MALPLITVNVEKDDKICEWVEMQGHTHCPSPTYEFIYAEKSVHTTSGDQPTSVDRPSPSSVHMTGQEEKTRGNAAISHPTLSRRCSNGNTGAEDSKNLGNPDDRFVKAMDELQDFVSQVC
jgi:hypothetical protein